MAGKKKITGSLEVSGSIVSIEEPLVVETKNILWADLVALRDAGELIPGQQYRITDYITTTVQANTQSAGHQFDIIVTADDVNKLNENARAVRHEGDTYFANSKLEAWKLKYCLDNDVNRFAWADEVNGKGVIYRMIDEFNNDVPYDFKNIRYQIRPTFTYNQWGGNYTFARDASLDMVITDIQYYGYVSDSTPSAWSSNTCWLRDDPATTSSVMYDSSGAEIAYGGTITAVTNKNYDVYTFSRTTTTAEDFDVSLNGFLYSCYGNTIRPAVIKQANDYQVLNRITFVGSGCYSNTFGNDCRYNTFGDNCHSNTLGNSCSNNTFGPSFYTNTLGNSCSYNTFIYSCSNNTFGNSCSFNTLGNSCSNNTFGNYCSNNTFGNYCYYNTFANSCSYNTFGNDCESNTFGNYCFYLQISDTSSTAKRYISVENGTRGASNANKFDLYDSAILNKNYQVTFKKDADGHYVMTWLDDYEKLEGKYKDNNIDTVWKALPQTAETIMSELVTAIEDTGWQPLEMTNASVSEIQSMFIRKIGNVVSLAGTFTFSSAYSQWAPSGYLAQLPLEYRPTKKDVEGLCVKYVAGVKGETSVVVGTNGYITLTTAEALGTRVDITSFMYLAR